MKRFRLDDSRISNTSRETGTKYDNDVKVEHADSSDSFEEENFEWKEITRGWITTPYIIYELTLAF